MILSNPWRTPFVHLKIWLAAIMLTIAAGFMSSGWRVGGFYLGQVTLLAFVIAYGAICGSMMFAGEPYRGANSQGRWKIWLNKSAFGALLVVTEALALAVILYFLGGEPSPWLREMFGSMVRQERNAGRFVLILRRLADPTAWFTILPLLSLEAYIWGLLGSSLTRRALPGAILAFLVLSVLWFSTWSIAELRPVSHRIHFAFRLISMVIVLTCSFTNIVLVFDRSNVSEEV